MNCLDFFLVETTDVTERSATSTPGVHSPISARHGLFDRETLPKEPDPG